jgi:hypothetical protein
MSEVAESLDLNDESLPPGSVASDPLDPENDPIEPSSLELVDEK